MSRDPEDPDTFDPDPDWADQADADEADAMDEAATLHDDDGLDVQRARLLDEVGSAAVEGEVVGGVWGGQIMRDLMTRYGEALDAEVAKMMRRTLDGWDLAGYTTDGSVFTVWAAPPKPLDLGDVASLPPASFGSPPPGSLIRTRLGGTHVDLIGGSPALHVDGRPVAWFENWLRNREMPS
jgi:hypothetical protein